VQSASSSARLRFAVTTAAITVVVTGCHDRSSPTLPVRSEVRTPVSVANVGNPQAWDTFVADVAITTTREGGKSNLPPTMPPIAYHLERSLQGNGKWRNVMTIDRSAMALALKSSVGRRLPATAVARIEDDGDGTPPRMYNADGGVVHTGQPPALPSSFPANPNTQSPVPTPRRTLSPAASPRMLANWIDGVVLTSQKTEERRESFLRAYGQPRVLSGATEYQVVRDSVTSIIRVDPSAQAITEVQHLVGGVLLGRWQFGYERQPDGTMIRSSISAEGKDRVTGGRRTTVTRFSNIRLEKVR